ncbi:MAG: enoyl-CoA hydratase/isomerase family protein [Rhodospirillales bacterium]|nr:enoyl-CoA hydratase/isomerase family protein [Rhodospirillales bacterium]
MVERIDDHVLLVTLNRPEVRNATNTKMGKERLELFSGLYVDQEDVRCVVLTAAGDKAFSAGGDLKERKGMTDAQWRRQHAIFEQGAMALKQCPVPVIGAINGVAYGGGCETALSCDFVYAVRGVRFALTEVRIGILPGTMGTQQLPRAVGERRAKEILMTGRPFTAEEAFDWGLVNKLCEPETLVPDALETAREIAGNAPLAVQRIKRSASVASDLDIATGYQFELEAYNRLVVTEDRQEGVNAFNENRKPRFKGC